MTHRFLAFDIETAKLTPDGENIQDHRPLGISCWAAAWIGTNGEPNSIVGHGGDKGEPAPRMIREECAELVDGLRAAVEDGFTLLTWNGCGFDFDILAEESGMHEECADLAMHHVDMMLHFHCLKGFPVGLDAVARGLGLSGKTAGMNGAKAPQLWAEGCYDDVLRYVAQDVRTTLEVALAVEQRCGLSWITKAGRTSHMVIPKWLTVFEALQLPEPDTSWMDSPIPREQFTEWMGYGR